MVSPDRIKHFIFTRFFSTFDPKYKRDIFDVNFMAERVLLAKNNFLKSLDNQTNKNFEVIFLMHERYFSDKKYSFIFTELKNCTTLPIRFLKIDQGEKLAIGLIKEEIKSGVYDNACNNYDFIIQTRMDYDDFVYKYAVEDTQNKVNECDSVICYGYCKGYTYFNEELFYFFSSIGTGHWSTFQSFIIKSSFAKKVPFLQICDFNHGQVKPRFKDILEKNGIEFKENMFQQDRFTNAFIWFRHDATWSSNGNPEVVLPKYAKLKKLTAADITKEQIEQEFGFFYDVKLSDQEQINEQFLPYISARLDILVKTKDFQIISISDPRASILKPEWLQKEGVYYIIQSHVGNLSIIAKSAVDTQLRLMLRGTDVHVPGDSSKRIPYWIDYTSLVINRKMIFDKPTPFCCEKIFDYRMNVKANEEIKIQVEWLPHRGDI